MGSVFPYRTVVLEQPVSLDLTTVDAVKEELDIKTTEQDAWIKRAIERASDKVTNFCDRQFAKAKVRDDFILDSVYNAHHPRNLYLSRPPVITVEGDPLILLGDSTDLGLAYQLGDVGDIWRLDGVDGARTLWGATAVSVTYWGGYELTPTMPADLEEAVIGLIKLKYFARKRDPLLKSENIPDIASFEYWVGQVGEVGDLPPDVRAALARFKRYTV